MRQSVFYSHSPGVRCRSERHWLSSAARSSATRLRSKDMPGIAAIHHPLGDVEVPAPAMLALLVQVGDFADRPAVHAHADSNLGMRLTSALRDLRSAQQRRRYHDLVRKTELRRTVAGRQPHELLIGRLRQQNSQRGTMFTELAQPLAFCSSIKRLGITDDVDEQDVSDLSRRLRSGSGAIDHCQPRCIGHRDLVNIAPLQLGEEVVDLHLAAAAGVFGFREATIFSKRQ